AAPQEPPTYAQVLAQPLDVGDQVMRGVRGQVRRRADSRGAAPAPARMEQYEAIRLGIEQPARSGRAAGAGAAMQHHGRLARRVAAEFPVRTLSRTYAQHGVFIRF